MGYSAWYELEQRCQTVNDAWACNVDAQSRGARYPAHLANLSKSEPLELEELLFPANSTVLFFGTSLLGQVMDNFKCADREMEYGGCVDLNQETPFSSRRGTSDACKHGRGVRVAYILNVMELQTFAEFSTMHWVPESEG